MKAALVREFPHLRGPSVESVFLGFNKYYTRCFLDPQPIPFACIDLTAANLDQACEEALQKVGTPAFFKPTTCSASVGVCSIENAQQLKKSAWSYISSDSFTLECSDANFMNLFYAKNIDEQKYSLASKPTAIIEEHMGGAIRTNTDSYVFDGKNYHWSISDNVYSQSKPRYCFGCFFSSVLPETQQKIWNLHDAIVGRMIDFGFNESFVNVETFLLDSGEVKLMEVNPRRGGNLLVSRKMFIGNLIRAQLKLAQGENPGPPVPNGRCALYGHVRTCGSGKAKEFYDYSYTNPALNHLRHPEEIVDGSGESGFVIGQTFLSGDSYKDVMQKHWSICRHVLLKPELTVWN